jgi:hypothetical protein
LLACPPQRKNRDGAPVCPRPSRRRRGSFALGQASKTDAPPRASNCGRRCTLFSDSGSEPESESASDSESDSESESESDSESEIGIRDRTPRGRASESDCASVNSVIVNRLAAAPKVRRPPITSARQWPWASASGGGRRLLPRPAGRTELATPCESGRVGPLPKRARRTQFAAASRAPLPTGKAS